MDAVPERDVGARVVAVDTELGRALEPARVAVGGTVEDHDRRAGRDVDAAECRRDAGEPEVAFDRALEPQRFLDEVRDTTTLVSEQLLEVGVLGDQQQRGAEEPHGGLLPGRKEVGRDAHGVDDFGRRAVGERRQREAGEHVFAWFAATRLDVGRELLVEELQRAVLHRVVAGTADRAARAGQPARNIS